MKCAICGNRENNKPYVLKEMMFGFRDEFKYFECSDCACFQIESIPQNMQKYYPDNYYSFSQEIEKPLKLNYFKQLQFDHLSGYKRSFFGALASYKYTLKLASWFKNMYLKSKNEKILDIGCGNGKLLKYLYQVGFTNLTGVDPYVEKDLIYDKKFRIFKKSIFEIKEQFDIIMMHHSLEHMDNQLDVLSHVNQLLNSNGKLLIRIPIMSQPLFEKYGVNMVFLDAPRHFFIHTIKSITTLLAEAGLAVKTIIYDAEVFDITASEMYMRNISIKDSGNYSVGKKSSLFSKSETTGFKKYIEELNKNEKGSSVAIYAEKKPG